MSHRSDTGYSYEGQTRLRVTNYPTSPNVEKGAGPGRAEQLSHPTFELPRYLFLAISRKAKKASLKLVYFAFQIPFFQTLKLSAEETITNGETQVGTELSQQLCLVD